jgi:hypothetical protein
VIYAEGKIVLDDGETIEFYIDVDGNISRWGNTNRILGLSVDATEAFRDALLEV